MSPEKENDETGAMIAYIAPFAMFMILTQIETFEALRPHYPWVYGAKIALIVATIIWCAGKGKWPPFSTKGFGLAIAFGLVGLVAWIGISQLAIEQRLMEVAPFLKNIIGERVGYNVWKEIPSQPGAIAFLAVRLIGLAIVVPIIEELFWRGFLLRYLIDERFNTVPIGTYTTFSFVIVTLFFALVHPEILAALVWGAGINFLLYRTQNLWAAVLGHAVTNLSLGIYVLTTGAWYYW